MNTSISLFLADDHAIFLDGLSGILEQVPALEVVGKAQNGAAAWSRLQELTVDVLITDIQMPEMDGIALTQKIKAFRPEQKVLVLSMYDDYSVIEQIFDAEAEGYVLKNAGKDELVKAIDRVHAGSSYYSKEVIRVLQEDQPKHRHS
ncbi:MAG: response regulator transcription factor, partial [Bacteroidota bacterium]